MKHVLPPPRLPSGQTDSNRFRDYTDDGGKGTWRHDLMGWWAVVQVHGPILAILAIFSRAPAVWTFVVAFLVVANRQHAMLLLGHETWHLSLFRSRAVNRVIGAWFCFYPMVMRYTVPRLAHLEHHRMVGREGDPYGYFWNFGADERKVFLAQVLSIATGLVFVRTLVGTVKRFG